MLHDRTQRLISPTSAQTNMYIRIIHIQDTTFYHLHITDKYVTGGCGFSDVLPSIGSRHMERLDFPVGGCVGSWGWG